LATGATIFDFPGNSEFREEVFHFVGLLFWSFMGERLLFPKIEVLPVGGECHLRVVRAIESQEMGFESVLPIGCDRDDVRNVCQKDEGVVNFPLGGGVGIEGG
jgi:hypothetical protein